MRIESSGLAEGIAASVNFQGSRLQTASRRRFVGACCPGVTQPQEGHPMTTPNPSTAPVSSAGAPIDHIAIVGGGAWGTALAMTAATAGRRVTLWVREAEVALDIRERRENGLFLPGHRLPESIAVETDLALAVRGADAVLLVVPSQFLRPTCEAMGPALKAGTPLVICAKGIEFKTGSLLADTVASVLPQHPVAVLSGPTFAHEVAQGQPTAVTIASDDVAADPAGSLAARLAVAIGTRTFRPYVSDDVRGVEVCGAVKNVLAIACGIAAGKGFGSNARAALITRGLNEIRELADALGGRRETVTGLAGIGDLTLTCSSEQSRNFRYGAGLAKGLTMAQIFDGRPVVVEGLENVVSVTDMARKLGLEMTICEAVRAVVIDHKPLGRVMAELLERPFRAESHGIDLVIAQPERDATARN